MASRQRRPRDVQARFNRAVSVVQSLPKDGAFQPSNMMKLKFYAFYKQATAGPCNITKPGFWDVTGRAKWEAWNMAGNMPKEEAMLNYVEELQKIVETMPQSKEVEDFLQSIGPFYEEMEETTQPSVDDARNEPTDSPKQTTAGVTVETFVDESKEKKEAESDSEEEIFSDPVGTPESQSPLMSPHHPLKSPFINSSSDSEEFVVVGNQAKPSMPMSVVGATTGVNRSKPEDGITDDTDHHDNAAITTPGQVMPQTETSVTEHNDNTKVSAAAVAMDEHSMSSQLDQVRRDLQSILHRLNSLEVLLQRRRVTQTRWWLRPLSNLSWFTLLLIVLWPILVNILWRKMRKYSNRLFITRH